MQMADFVESRAQLHLCSNERPTLLAALVAALSTLTVGYALGYSSTALGDLAGLPDGYAFELTSKISGLFAALVPAAAIFSSPVGGMLSDWIGRKKILVVSGFPNAIGWIMIAVSPYITSPLAFKLVILSGRFLTGISVGWMCVVSPNYMAEVAVSKYRGRFTAFYHLSMIAGVFLSYGVGAIPFISYNHSAVFITGIIIINEILIITVIPESPRWLLAKGHEACALKALRWLRRSEEIAREEAGEIKKFLETTPKLSLKQKLLELRKKHVYLAVFALVPLPFIIQLSGYNVITAYSAIILETSGIKRARETALYAIGALQLIGAAISSILMDKVGRKPLLMLGGIGTVIGSIGLGTYFYVTQPSFCDGDRYHGSGMLNSSPFNDDNSTLSDDFVDDDTAFDGNNHNSTGDTAFCNQQLNSLAICSLVTYCFAHSLGWRCAPSIVQVEMCPLRLRGVLSGIIDSFSWIVIATYVGFYYEYEKAIGQHTVWWLFGLISLLGLVFMMAFVPETKGKTLEEVETHFKTNYSLCGKTPNMVKFKTGPSAKNNTIYEETAV